MGILRSIDAFFSSSPYVRYNFNKWYENFKIRNPEIKMYRDHEHKPCVWYVSILDNKNRCYMNFYMSSLDSTANYIKMCEFVENGLVLKVSHDFVTDYHCISFPKFNLNPPSI
jgi:hypothetical protein